MTDADPNEFNNGVWLKDTSIGFAFEYLQNVAFKDCKNIVFLNPSIVSIINFEDEVNELYDALEGAGVYDNNLIFFPINNFFITQGIVNQFRGSHWSLLAFDRSSMTFFHYDSGDQSNLMVARNFSQKLLPLMIKKSKNNEQTTKPDTKIKKETSTGQVSETNKVSSDNSSQNTEEKEEKEVVKEGKSLNNADNNNSKSNEIKITAASTPQQNNAYDCGMYTIEVARVLASVFVEKGSIANYELLEKYSKAEKDKRKWISPDYITKERKEWKKKVSKGSSFLV